MNNHTHKWKSAETSGSKNGVPYTQGYYTCECGERSLAPSAECTCVHNYHYCRKHRGPDDYGFSSSLD
jgi:hypothetical protein